MTDQREHGRNEFGLSGQAGHGTGGARRLFGVLLTLIPLLMASVPQDDALFTAAGAGDLRQVDRLLKQGANVNAHSGEFQWTPLHLAALNGHLPVVERLLKAGAALTTRDSEGNAAPRRAQRKGAEIPNLLILRLSAF